MSRSSSAPRLFFGATFLGVLLVAGTAVPSAAEGEPSRYGGRLGFSISPDQFVLGGYMGFPLAEPSIRARPSVDFGFGDNRFTILLNGDFQYDFLETTLKPIPFAGAGLNLAYNNKSDAAGGGSNTEIGVSLYGGLEFDLGGYKTAILEARLGISDIPDFKLLAALGFF